MKTIAIALFLIVFAMPAAAYPVIGIFEDTDPQNAECHADIEPFIFTSVWVCAQLSVELDEVITAAEFRIDGFPTGADVLVTQNWNTDLVIGNADYGIALAFSPPLPALFAVLGELQVFSLSSDWPGDDYWMYIGASNSSGLLVLVDGNYQTLNADGGEFYFNPTGPYNFCPYIAQPPTATENISWGAMKALY
jgi:hypothetical protein